MNLVIAAAGSLLAARLGAELVLSALNRAEVRRWRLSPPAAAAAVMDADTFAKSADYTLAKSRFGAWSEIFDAAVLAAVLFGGVLPRFYAAIAGWGAPGAAWTGAFFVIASFILLSIPGLPWAWHEQFGIEARFGFNRSTRRLWVADRIKGLALSAGLGFPLLWAVFSLIRAAGPAWWLWGFALVFGFQMAMLLLYPRWILPWFNRLTPLPEGDLRRRLVQLSDRTGFRAAAIQVMDGSRRSAHSNAFFTGFGRFRRIVLFDTLVERLDPSELEAVLAHEIGHYRRGHVPRTLALSAIMLLAGFWVVAQLIRASWFAPAFGFTAGAAAPAALICSLLGGAALYWLSPLFNLLSRHHEYQADAFARDAMGGPAPIVGALRKLARDNLSNLTPHPLFSAFHYSHPTLVEREAALAAVPGGR